jgi:hypothetical protein
MFISKSQSFEHEGSAQVGRRKEIVSGTNAYLNLSWPAVSQTWSLTDFPPTLTIFEPNSTPIVWLLSCLTARERKKKRNQLFQFSWGSRTQQQQTKTFKATSIPTFNINIQSRVLRGQETKSRTYICSLWTGAASKIFQHQRCQSRGTWRGNLEIGWRCDTWGRIDTNHTIDSLLRKCFVGGIP